MVNARAFNICAGRPQTHAKTPFNIIIGGFGCARKRLHCGGLSTEIVETHCVLYVFCIRCKVQGKAPNVEKLCGNERKRAETSGNDLRIAAETPRQATRKRSKSCWQRCNILMENSMEALLEAFSLTPGQLP